MSFGDILTFDSIEEAERRYADVGISLSWRYDPPSHFRQGIRAVFNHGPQWLGFVNEGLRCILCIVPIDAKPATVQGGALSCIECGRGPVVTDNLCLSCLGR